MENKGLIKEMVKLQVLCVRWVEKNTNLKCSTLWDMDRILKGSKFTITYEEAVKNLRRNIEKYCKNEYLLNAVLQLEDDINNSEIKNLRFGLEPQRNFSDLEKELNTEVLKRTLFMTNGMVGIKYIVENLGLTESAVKQACQQERLLNTKKIGNNWVVHIPECRAYWNIPDTNDNNLCKDWEY
jgi:hypothetical protein